MELRAGKPLDVREATLADLDGIVDLHTQARLAYYGAGGLASESDINMRLELTAPRAAAPTPLREEA